MIRNAILALAAALLLAGCAGAVPWNPQGHAGINEGEFAYNPETGEITGHVIGGKEQDTVALNVETPDGLKVSYSASGVLAFDGQTVRGAVEQAVSEDVKEAAPGIVDSIVDAVRKAVTGGL